MLAANPMLRALIIAALSALLTHLGYYASPPPVKPAADVESTPKPKKKIKPPPVEEEEEEAVPAPMPQKKKKPNPLAAIGRIQFGGAGCTATVIAPRRSDGRWDVLTASHCINRVGQKGTMTLRDGRRFGVTVQVYARKPDCAWLVAETTDGTLPFAELARSTPQIGAKVWHAGFGIDKPGNREDGTLTTSVTADGQIEYRLSVSPGDSGGAIVDDATGQVLSPVCCTSAFARPADVYGACPEACWATRPAASNAQPSEQWERDAPPCSPDRCPLLVG